MFPIRRQWHYHRVNKRVVRQNPTSRSLKRRSSMTMRCWYYQKFLIAENFFLMRDLIGGSTERSRRDDIILVASSLFIAAIPVLTPMFIATALVITVASPLQCWRRPRQRGRFGVEVVEATIGCWPCTVRCSGFGDEGDCSIQRTCYPKCHHVSIAEEGRKRRMPCRQTIAVFSQFHWFTHGARG